MNDIPRGEVVSDSRTAAITYGHIDTPAPWPLRSAMDAGHPVEIADHLPGEGQTRFKGPVEITSVESVHGTDDYRACFKGLPGARVFFQP